MRKDLVCSLALLIVAGTYYAFSTQIPESALADEVGPTGLPTILSILLAIAAVAIGARALVSAPAAARAPSAGKEKEASVPRAFGMLGIVILYVLLVPVLGYFVALALLLAGVPLYEGRRPSWPLFAIAIGGAGAFWLLFNVVLGVRQPEGFFF